MTALCLAFAALWPVLRTDAHPMPESLVWLDVHADGIQVELRLPVDALAKGFGRALRPNVRQRTAQLRDSLSAYIADHIALSGVEGKLWHAQVQHIDVVTEDGADEVWATVWFAAPDGIVPAMLTMQYDLIIHELRTHKALVAIRTDEARGINASDPQYVGRLTWHTDRIVIDRTERIPPIAAWVPLGAVGFVFLVGVAVVLSVRRR
ncbi:MAG: hypothetical protein AAGJ10_15335 [Bacteroidota bacterium]